MTNPSFMVDSSEIENAGRGAGVVEDETALLNLAYMYWLTGGVMYSKTTKVQRGYYIVLIAATLGKDI